MLTFRIPPRCIRSRLFRCRRILGLLAAATLAPAVGRSCGRGSFLRWCLSAVRSCMLALVENEQVFRIVLTEVLKIRQMLQRIEVKNRSVCNPLPYKVLNDKISAQEFLVFSLR